jgi:hypothetical protein
MAIVYGTDKPLTIVVGEMNKAAVLDATAAYLQFAENAPDDAFAINGELNYTIVRHAPCRITYQGVVLAEGTHTVTVDDFDIHITLPVTRECLLGLPASLSERWIQEALAKNRYTVDHIHSFLVALLSRANTAPKPDSASSNS